MESPLARGRSGAAVRLLLGVRVGRGSLRMRITKTKQQRTRQQTSSKNYCAIGWAFRAAGLRNAGGLVDKTRQASLVCWFCVLCLRNGIVPNTGWGKGSSPGVRPLCGPPLCGQRSYGPGEELEDSLDAISVRDSG